MRHLAFGFLVMACSAEATPRPSPGPAPAPATAAPPLELSVDPTSADIDGIRGAVGPLMLYGLDLEQYRVNPVLGDCNQRSAPAVASVDALLTRHAEIAPKDPLGRVLLHSARACVSCEAGAWRACWDVLPLVTLHESGEALPPPARAADAIRTELQGILAEAANKKCDPGLEARVASLTARARAVDPPDYVLFEAAYTLSRCFQCKLESNFHCALAGAALERDVEAETVAALGDLASLAEELETLRRTDRAACVARAEASVPKVFEVKLRTRLYLGVAKDVGEAMEAATECLQCEPTSKACQKFRRQATKYAAMKG